MPRRIYVTCRHCGRPVKLSEARSHLATKCRVARSQEVAAGIKSEYKAAVMVAKEVAQ